MAMTMAKSILLERLWHMKVESNETETYQRKFLIMLKVVWGGEAGSVANQTQLMKTQANLMYRVQSKWSLNKPNLVKKKKKG